MAYKSLTNVLQSCATPGTAAFGSFATLLGRDTFIARLTTGDTFDYMAMAVDSNGIPTGNWEQGSGTWTGTAITRSSINRSSNADAVVNFTDANVYVFGVVSPQDLILAQSDNSFQIPSLGYTTPITPASGNLGIFGRTIAGKGYLAQIGPSGLDTALQPLLARNKIGYWCPPGSATTVPGVFGIAAPTTTGTATARNAATTSLAARMRRLGYVSSTTAGSLAYQYWTAGQFSAGSGSSDGSGFLFVARFVPSDAAAVTGARFYCGIGSNVSAPTNVEPNTLTNHIGIAQLSTDATQFYLVYGGSAAQTAIALGTTLGAPNTLGTVAWEIAIFAPPNTANSFSVEITNLTTGAKYSNTLTGAATVVPQSTTLLAPRVWKTNNATALAVGYDLCSLYVETDT